MSKLNLYAKFNIKISLKFNDKRQKQKEEHHRLRKGMQLLQRHTGGSPRRGVRRCYNELCRTHKTSFKTIYEDIRKEFGEEELDGLIQKNEKKLMALENRRKKLVDKMELSRIVVSKDVRARTLKFPFILAVQTEPAFGFKFVLEGRLS